MEESVSNLYYDVIVIGSGPGGYVAAIRAAQLGFRVAIVEYAGLGGICLNWGCIPTKSLLRSAEILDHIKNAKHYGLNIEGKVQPNIKDIVKRSRDVSHRLNRGVEFLMHKNKIDIIWGRAVLNNPSEIIVSKPSQPIVTPQHPIPKKTLGEGIYKAKHIVIATGARPRNIEGIEPDANLIWTYFDALKPSKIPKSLVIMGSGAIGVEFASFYKSLGVDVSLIEVKDRILPAEDVDISHFVQQSLQKKGIKILTESKISSVKTKEETVLIQIEKKDGSNYSMQAERLLLSVGVQGNIENLGLDKLGVKTNNGCIVVDDYGGTNIPGIYAIGDVAGAPMLAHKAEHEGIICIEKIAKLSTVSPLNKRQIPGCTYCNPQVASIGLTEEKARDQGLDIRVGKHSFSANGKAITLGEDSGIIKTIFDNNTGEVLGVHMVGAEVTELIQGFSIAMNLESTEEELMHTVFPHPTLSETMKESILDAYGRAIHS
ncbi:dihydrolipoyl dehydrogenase [Candidatus Liberibacter africanus]|uniref:Dihydrolipoyl dehydrogenase n=1 Tax=Candidatus Liberibacter africanus PTSAPSY TaxID=1277257 RepID=A0A0G3I259_LIBAF|nr:dihydrolipoyl dehydrogenase [Candidatus Liberibacter africanus]AKK19929.1 dihydrolipoamide dehydrogenase [Candidatus Liberibacter africanus PTSAPSY]QTP63773.1 dihydrolipoyl dehydrogenase [Candidatus Liberibacter africanus]